MFLLIQVEIMTSSDTVYILPFTIAYAHYPFELLIFETTVNSFMVSFMKKRIVFTNAFYWSAQHLERHVRSMHIC